MKSNSFPQTGIAEEELSENESFYEMNDVKRVQSTEI